MRHLDPERVERVVLLLGPPPHAGFLLSNPVFDASGFLKSGWVVNGAWHLEVTEIEMMCRVGDEVRARYARAGMIIVTVPNTMLTGGANYNAVIDWARQQVLARKDTPKE